MTSPRPIASWKVETAFMLALHALAGCGSFGATKPSPGDGAAGDGAAGDGARAMASDANDASAARPPDGANRPAPLDALSAADRRVSADVRSIEAGPSLPPTSRTQTELAKGWKFKGSSTAIAGAEAIDFNDSSWAPVSVPHTWDNVRKVTPYAHAWYRLRFPIPASAAGQSVYLAFDGVFQVTDVYLNGKHLGQYRGGYTRFVFDATAAAKVGAENVLAVKVSNSSCTDCLPDLMPRLWKGYGGIYRKAWLVTTHAQHVATTHYASRGVYVTTTKVSAASADVSIQTYVTNDAASRMTLTVRTAILDAAGTEVFQAEKDVAVDAHATTSVTQTGTVTAPRLWSPADPNLYGVTATVKVGGAVTDAVGDRIGFRWFSLSTSEFLLNGRSVPLRGTNKHQETEHGAAAVSDADLVAEWDEMQELGINYVRLAHYPHARIEYDLADEMGFVVWAENGHTNSGPPTPNGNELTRAMIYQNYNHPSIVFWSAGNEAKNVEATSAFAGVIKATDPTRLAVYASNGQTPANVDFVFRNTYSGWYGTSTPYSALTSSIRLVSESGGGMVISTHTPDFYAQKKTVDSYEPEEYGAFINEVRFEDLWRTPTHVPVFSQWVFRDFGDDKYKKVINTKGLVTFAGFRKDIWYHYRSLLRSDPLVHIVGRHYFLRKADAAGKGPVKVYSNAASLRLTVNGADKGTASNGYTPPGGSRIRNVFLWPDALVVGKNVIVADDGAGHTDTATVYFTGTGTTLPKDAGARIRNLASSNGPAYFIDVPVRDQWPFYVDFDGHGDNTFDVVPAAAAGASFIATRRQSDESKRTELSFDLAEGADLFIMATDGGSVPAWVTNAGFADTGTRGQWRDDSLALVNYRLYKKTAAAGAHVAVAPTAMDWVLLVK